MRRQTLTTQSRGDLLPGQGLILDLVL